MRGIGGTAAGVPIGPHLAENLSAVFACVQIIAETVATLPLLVYRREGDGKVAGTRSSRRPPFRTCAEQPADAGRIPGDDDRRIACCAATPIARSSATTAALRSRYGRCIPTRFPFCASPVRAASFTTWPIPPAARGACWPMKCLHLKDRSDDGIIGKSRLQRARETFGIALATETHAGIGLPQQRGAVRRAVPSGQHRPGRRRSAACGLRAHLPRHRRKPARSRSSKKV